MRTYSSLTEHVNKTITADGIGLLELKTKELAFWSQS